MKPNACHMPAPAPRSEAEIGEIAGSGAIGAVQKIAAE